MITKAFVICYMGVIKRNLLVVNPRGESEI